MEEPSGDPVIAEQPPAGSVGQGLDPMPNATGTEFQLHPGEAASIDLDNPTAVAAARRFRDVLGRFCSGVTVVTGLFEGRPVGMTCQSFSSVSLEPQLVLFSPARTSRAWPLIERSGAFCVNILAADQEWLSNRMATRGADKFRDLDWAPSAQTGSPVLTGTLGYVDCELHAVHEAGDHFVVLGRVRDLMLSGHGDPLLFFEGRYRGLDDQPSTAPGGPQTSR